MILKRLLESRSHANDRAVPENGRGCLPPLCMWCKENGLIPEKPPVDAAIGLRLSRVFTLNSAQLFCDEMLRVPKLSGALVGDSRQRPIHW